MKKRNVSKNNKTVDLNCSNGGNVEQEMSQSVNNGIPKNQNNNVLWCGGGVGCVCTGAGKFNLEKLDKLLLLLLLLNLHPK